MTFLGIDVGTSGTKALLLSEAGKVIAAAEAPHETLVPRSGWSEQRPEDWWTSTVAAVRKVLGRAGRPRVRAIGLSGQMHGSVFLDRRGKVLRPALLWNDQRTQAECEEIEKLAGGRRALVRMVGNPALTGFTAPKILWLRKHEPARFKRVAAVLLPKDYIRYRLTGDLATDVADASGTLLLDVAKRRWHRGLIARLGLDEKVLPRLYESSEVTGTVMAGALAELGLAGDIPVVAGAGDQAAGAVGAGVVEPGTLSATIGTSGVVFAAAREPVVDPLGRVHTMCHAVAGRWCLFGCMLSAGGSLQWTRDTFFAEEAAKAKDKGDVYPRMLALAEATPPGAEGLLFAPYLTGERCPHADANVRGAFLGLTPRHRLGHLVRAVVEGVTFGMREQVDIFRSLGVDVSEIRAAGGGARSAFWRQLQADVYGAPVVTVNVAEGAALGAAILAGVGAGAFAGVEAACGRIIATGRASRPNRARQAIYERRLGAYRFLYPALAALGEATAEPAR